MNILNIFRKKSKTKLNKCDYCDLYQTLKPKKSGEVVKIDKWFSDINELYKLNIIPHRYSKSIDLSSGETSYCLINSLYWRNKQKRCPHWQATVNADPSSAISLHQARQTNRLSKVMFWLVLVLGFPVLVEIFKQAKSLSEKIPWWYVFDMIGY